MREANVIMYDYNLIRSLREANVIIYDYNLIRSLREANVFIYDYNPQSRRLREATST